MSVDVELAGAGEQGSARRRGRKGQNGGGDVAQMKDESLQILVEDVGVVKSDLSPQHPVP